MLACEADEEFAIIRFVRYAPITMVEIFVETLVRITSRIKRANEFVVFIRAGHVPIY